MRIFIIILIQVFLLGVIFASGVRADTACPSPAFHIEGVEVGVDSEGSTIKARSTATRRGRLQAWQILQEKVLLPGQAIEPVSGNTAQIVEGILDYTSIAEETVLENRYQGRFDYCFDRLKTRDYLRSRGLRHAELVSGKTLVVPIWSEAFDARLWREPNPWLDAWRVQLDEHVGLVAFSVPASLAAERGVRVEDVRTLEAEAIAEAVRLEGAERAIIAILESQTALSEQSPGQENAGQESGQQESGAIAFSITVQLYHADGRLDRDIARRGPFTVSRGDLRGVLEGLAAEVALQVEGDWRIANALNFDKSGVLQVYIPVGSLDEWTHRLAVLERVPSVERLEIMQLSAQGGVVRLHLVGRMETLLNALEQHRLKMQGSGSGGGAIPVMLVPMVE